MAVLSEKVVLEFTPLVPWVVAETAPVPPPPIVIV
jgi:hypothetical protein